MKYIYTISLLLILAAPHATFAIGEGLLGCGAAGGGALASGVASAAAGLEVPVSDSVTRKATTEVSTKECILDGLVVAIRQGLISAITESIVNWINSGFEGSPAFVTDLNSFLRDVADETALDFIQGSDLAGLCSPFELEVRIALALDYQRTFRDRAECTLGDVTDNIEDFLGGNFSAGGWPAWFRLHADPQNSPFGAYLISRNELAQQIASAQGEELAYLDWGDGFFSKKECAEYENTKKSAGGQQQNVGSSLGSAPKCLEWKIVTPGTQIDRALGDALGSGYRQLELADEIDEIVSALLAQLAQQALTGVQGLFGLSQNSDGRGSYLDRLVDETEGGSIEAGKDALDFDLRSAIANEEEYVDVLEDIIDDLDSARDAMSAVYECYLDLGSGISSTISSVTALERANTASSTIKTSLNPQLALRTADLTRAESAIDELEQLRSDLRLTRTAEEVNAAANDLDALVAGGLVHSAAELSLLITDRAVGKAALEQFETDARTQLSECRQY